MIWLFWRGRGDEIYGTSIDRDGRRSRLGACPASTSETLALAWVETHGTPGDAIILGRGLSQRVLLLVVHGGEA